MTRVEYMTNLQKRWGYVIDPELAFPKVLWDTAAQLFVEGDVRSRLAKETRRRLKQLEDNGITDP